MAKYITGVLYCGDNLETLHKITAKLCSDLASTLRRSVGSAA
jgi:hypothetical protein